MLPCEGGQQAQQLGRSSPAGGWASQSVSQWQAVSEWVSVRECAVRQRDAQFTPRRPASWRFSVQHLSSRPTDVLVLVIMNVSFMLYIYIIELFNYCYEISNNFPGEM